MVLILNDGAYGMIKWKQANMGFDNFGLDYGNPDFVQYANSYGANGHRVTSAGALCNQGFSFQPKSRGYFSSFSSF